MMSMSRSRMSWQSSAERANIQHRLSVLNRNCEEKDSDLARGEAVSLSVSDGGHVLKNACNGLLNKTSL